MFRLFKEIYLTAFTVFFRISAWGPKTSVGVSIASIAMIESCILIGAVACADVLTRTDYLRLFPKWTVTVLVLFLFVLNHYCLVTRRSGIEFEHEFTHFKRSKKIQLVAVCATFVLAAGVFVVYSANLHRAIFGHK